MERYTFQIVAQGVVKSLWIIVDECSAILFGPRVDYGPQIRLHLLKSGFFHYTPFLKSDIGTISLFSYRTHCIHTSIWQMKFKNRRLYAELFGELVADSLIDLLSEITPLYDFTDPILCVVPSHKKTNRKRGYQPTDLIARSCIRHGLSQWATYIPRLIIKHRHIPRQSHIKQRNQRLLNPKNAFLITEPSVVKNSNIILLDDVFTTGATLNECTKMLRQFGARRILRVTIAH